MRFSPMLWLTAAGALLGCAPREAAPRVETPLLLTSVQASTFPDSVQFLLQVTNTSADPVTLEFGSGQSFDFIVSREGQEVWRWSADRMFTQALRSEVLGASETRSYRATWTPGPQTPGEYRVTGILTAREHHTRQEARFRIP